MLIKYLLIVVILLIVWRITGQFRQGRLNGRVFLLWLLFWALGIFVILRPETATLAANLVGVGRGADFVTYLSVILLFYLSFKILTRQERMEKDITKLARKLSILSGTESPTKKEENNEKNNFTQ